MRFSAAVMKKSMSSEASSVPELSQRLKESFTNVSTAAEASLFESFSLVCPANCGSGILQESTKAERAEMSSGMSFTPRGRRFLKSQYSLTASSMPCLKPFTWVPPRTVGMRLT